MQSFRQAIFTLNTLPSEPLLHLALYAGLAALKLPACYERSTKNDDCPVCDAALGRLANEVPASHHVNSTIVCSITGKIMDADNMPMALPNGYVYSKEVCPRFSGSRRVRVAHVVGRVPSPEPRLWWFCCLHSSSRRGHVRVILTLTITITQALEDMATKNDGVVTCPRTGLTCSFSDLRKVFIS